jgi:hypothetical protein
MVLPPVLLVLDAWPLGRWRASVASSRARASVAGSVGTSGEGSVGTNLASSVAGSSVPARHFLALLDLIAEKAPFFALSAIFAALAMWGQASIPGALVSWSDHTLGERIVQCFYGLAFYPAKTLAPVDLSPIYGLPDSVSLAQPRFAVAVLAVIVAIALCVRFRARVPVLLAAAVAFALAIAPVLGLTQAGPQLVADRYSYIACIPFALVAGGALFELASSTWRTIAIAGAVIVVGMLVTATRAQTALWKDSALLWTHALEIEPNNALNHLNLAQARIEQASLAADPAQKRAHLADAQRLLERGLAQKQHALLYASLARVHQVLWEMDPASKDHHEIAALEAMQRAVELARSTNQYTPDYQLNLGSALFNAGRVDEAIVELASYLHDRPDSFLGRYNLGFALVRKARFEEGARELEYATRLEPTHVNAWGNLGLAYEAAGDAPRAIEAYRRVLALAPDHRAAAAHLRELTRHER